MWIWILGCKCGVVCLYVSKGSVTAIEYLSVVGNVSISPICVDGCGLSVNGMGAES